MTLVDGVCWGLGGEAVGRSHPLDLLICRGCGRRIARAAAPVWFLGDPYCVGCAVARHLGCPCAA